MPEQLAITFVVNYHDPSRMNQADVTRHFPTQHQAEEFIQELYKIAPDATNVRLDKITTRRERIH